MSKWSMVPLEKLASPVERLEIPTPGTAYRQVGVKLWGEGAYQRETIDGGATKYKTLSRVEANDIIVNKIWARNGSVALIPKSLAGSYVSGEFPTFTPIPGKLEPLWFHWLTKTQFFWDQCDEKSRGTSGKNRIRPERFLEIDIPLPPLPEQQRIVARIESLVAKIEEARTVRGGTIGESEAILAAEELKIWPEENLRNAQSLEDVTTFLARGRQSEQGESDHFLIKSQHVQMGKYIPTVLKLAPYVASKVAPEAFLRDKDILIACSAAGCLGRVAFYNDSSQKASTDTHVAIARPLQAVVIPEYLFAYLRGVQGQVQLRSREKGDWTREKIGFRLTELNVADMRRIPVPVPPISEQRRIVTYLAKLRAKVDVLNQLQAETTTELNALLPSILDKAFKGEL